MPKKPKKPLGAQQVPIVDTEASTMIHTRPDERKQLGVCDLLSFYAARFHRGVNGR